MLFFFKKKLCIFKIKFYLNIFIFEFNFLSKKQKQVNRKK